MVMDNRLLAAEVILFLMVVSLHVLLLFRSACLFSTARERREAIGNNGAWLPLFLRTPHDQAQSNFGVFPISEFCLISPWGLF